MLFYCWSSDGHFSIKMLSCDYGSSSFKIKMVSFSYPYNGNPIFWKIVFILKQSPCIFCSNSSTRSIRMELHQRITIATTVAVKDFPVIHLVKWQVVEFCHDLLVAPWSLYNYRVWLLKGSHENTLQEAWGITARDAVQSYSKGRLAKHIPRTCLEVTLQEAGGNTSKDAVMESKMNPFRMGARKNCSNMYLMKIIISHLQVLWLSQLWLLLSMSIMLQSDRQELMNKCVCTQQHFSVKFKHLQCVYACFT